MNENAKDRLKKTFTNPFYFIALGFGSGLSRWMPGTTGSLAAIPVYLLFQPLDIEWQLLIIVIAFALGVFICDWVAKDMAVKDPGCIVWDEFVGLWITYLMLPPGWIWLVVGFLLFRLFDIWKPWPVSWLDRQLSGGLGIMADDVAAGLYALLFLQSIYLGSSLIG